MLASLLPHTIVTYSILTILKGRYSEVARIGWVLYSLSWEHEANEHLIDLLPTVVLEVCVSVRVLRVVSEVSALSTVAELGEADVQAVFALVDDFRCGSAST